MKTPALALAALALASCAQAQTNAPAKAEAPIELSNTTGAVFTPLLKKEHPRLLASQAQFDALKIRVQNEPWARQVFVRVRSIADKTLAEEPSKYEIPDGLRLLATSRRVLDRSYCLSMAWQMTGDAKYLQRLWVEPEAAGNFPDWNPRHFLHGGSIPSTADNLYLKASFGTDRATTGFSWSAEAYDFQAGAWRPSSTYPTSASGLTHNINLKPQPGWFRWTCKGRLQNGSTGVAVSDIVEVGIRSDDYILIGWIDPNKVPMSTAGLPGWIANNFPANGKLNLKQSALAYPFLGFLSECGKATAREPYRSSDANAPGTYFFTSQRERNYVLNWMFYRGANRNPASVIPGGDFVNFQGTAIDYAKVAQFLRPNVATRGLPGYSNFKMFNRLQVKYQVQFGQFTGPPLGQIIGARFLDRSNIPATAVGRTIDPINYAFGYAGQVGPMEGKTVISATRISRINDGSPDDKPIRAFNTLTNPLGIYWENIGAQIRLTSQNEVQVIQQPYPTYYLYRNGRRVAMFPQAAQPLGNFNRAPHPFGTVPTIRSLGTVPAGRNGDASSAPDASANNPRYIIP